jgi:hypothetical protein
MQTTDEKKMAVKKRSTYREPAERAVRRLKGGPGGRCGR